MPILHAILFAIHDCGFIARIAVEVTGSNEVRFEKIVRIIGESRLSVHDISRVELGSNDLPRFNMPFECGLALGAIRYGVPRNRDFLVMCAVPYQDQQTLSDLSGQDARAHHDDAAIAMGIVRSFLANKSPVGMRTRGAAAIRNRYVAFQAELPSIARRVEITPAEIVEFDYLRDWLLLMSEWLLSRVR